MSLFNLIIILIIQSNLSIVKSLGTLRLRGYLRCRGDLYGFEIFFFIFSLRCGEIYDGESLRLRGSTVYQKLEQESSQRPSICHFVRFLREVQTTIIRFSENNEFLSDFV